MGWFKDLFAPTDPKDFMKYIGYIPGQISWTKNDKKQKPITFKVMFFMSDSGKRHIEWPEIKISGMPDPNYLEWQEGVEAAQWAKGGPFPEAFEPETDTLGPMLIKLVDINMGLTKDDGEKS